MRPILLVCQQCARRTYNLWGSHRNTGRLVCRGCAQQAGAVIAYPCHTNAGYRPRKRVRPA